MQENPPGVPISLSSINYSHMPLDQKRAIVAELLRRKSNSCNMQEDHSQPLRVDKLENGKNASDSAMVGDPAEAQTLDNPTPTPPTPFRTKAASQGLKTPLTEIDPIAIIGVAGHFPQSPTLEEFGENLMNGREMITEAPRDRWSRGESQSAARYGGFLDDVEAFDAQFFGISEKEAASMDPHQRLFLETVWETIEDAGYQVDNLTDTLVGLFVGMYSLDYNYLLFKQQREAEIHSLIGRLNVMVANRVSYQLNLRGPSELIDTACSSSLVAIHRAVNAIRSGECEVAVAGGVSVLLSPEGWDWFGKADLLSPDGKCRPFEKDAHGLVRGEGVGAVLLKPLSRAASDGDHIYALIKGSAVNHNGRFSNSLTTPSTNAQADLVVHAYENAHIDPETVGFIEAHGAASEAGDFVEINAFKSAFETLSKRLGKPTLLKHYCGIGSLKPNIGALEAAGGIAAVIKILLALQNKKLPATINFQQCHPDIDLSDGPFYIVSETRDWQPICDANGTPLPRRAGVHAYGLGGANAHVLMEEYELPPKAKCEEGLHQEHLPELIVLSAKNKGCLEEYARRLRRWLETTPAALSDIAYTLQVGRQAMVERLSIIASSKEELKQKLDEFIRGQVSAGVLTGHADPRSCMSDIATAIRGHELRVLAENWVAGAETNWQQLYGRRQCRRISMPTYPFTRERFPLPRAAGAGSSRALHPLLDQVIPSLRGAIFKKQFRPVEPVIRDHVFGGHPIVPASAYLEMARAAGNLVNRGTVNKLQDVVFPTRLPVPETGVEVQVCLEEADDRLVFRVMSRPNGSTLIHCRGALTTQASAVNIPVQRADFRRIQARCQREIDKEEIYSLFGDCEIGYGPFFRSLERIWLNDGEALGQIHVSPGTENDSEAFGLHPTVIDAALQISFVLSSSRNGSGQAMLPFSLEELEILGPSSVFGYAYLKVAGVSEKPRIAKYNAVILDETGRVLIKMRGLCSKEVPPRQLPAKEILAQVEAGKLSIDKAERLLDNHQNLQGRWR